MQIHLQGIENFTQISPAILNYKENARVFAFYGQMGAGKTTLIKALCNQLNVATPTSSPSFSIVNEYLCKDNRKIYHFDFYRIRHQQEAIDIGLEDYLYSNHYCFIEWPEKIDNLLPENFVRVRIEVNSDNSRTIIISQA